MITAGTEWMPWSLPEPLALAHLVGELVRAEDRARALGVEADLAGQAHQHLAIARVLAVA